MNESAEIKKEMPNYIAGGNPTEDTLRHYNTEINNFLTWCKDNAYNVLTDINGREAFEYLRYLNTKKYSAASISLKISAAKTFYFVAKKLEVFTNDNPFEDVKPKKAAIDDTDFNFFSVEELKEIIDIIIVRNDIATLRDIAIIMLMAVEGLRTVEVHRMSDEDIDFNRGRILIHGKGKSSYIYPCEDTFNTLKNYLNTRPQPIADDEGTPTFIGYSKKFFGERISRNGIRFTVNNILKNANLRKHGESCHTLRHSCGTNLYSETKDLRLVQETLRHSDPATSARYAHIVDRLDERQTKKISPLKK